jgi:hypothetical protein
VPSRARSSSTLIAIGGFAIGVLGAVLVLKGYGGGSFWPGLIAGFLGTLVAFLLALNSARERDRLQLEQDVERERVRLGREAEKLEEQRATEIRRRLELVRAELEKNVQSFQFLDEAFEDKGQREALAASAEVEDGVPFLFHPQLLDGAWAASAPRLSELIADYKLIADLGTAYGGIEELRWRVRLRTEKESTILDEPIRALATELRNEVEGLIKRIGGQIDKPNVQPVEFWKVLRATDDVIRAAIVGTGSRIVGARTRTGSGKPPDTSEP